MGDTLRTPVVDLLSDTLTRPTEGMRQAMAAAAVGDDVFGEDPTVRELEQRVADLLGHEAGLFTPTGSMANQLGIRLHVKPGEELIADSLAHVLRAEMGAAAVLSGISSRSWVAPHGLLELFGAVATLGCRLAERRVLLNDDARIRGPRRPVVAHTELFEEGARVRRAAAAVVLERDELERARGAGHRHIQEAALLVGLRVLRRLAVVPPHEEVVGEARRALRREAPLDEVGDDDELELLALRLVDGHDLD